MNKFSSLSTSVLLALLTSSTSVSTYANSMENLNSRTSARSSNDSGESNTLRIGSNNRNKNSDHDLEPLSLPSINTSNNNYYSDDIVFQAHSGNYIAYQKPHSALNDNPSLDPALTHQKATIYSAYENPLLKENNLSQTSFNTDKFSHNNSVLGSKDISSAFNHKANYPSTFDPNSLDLSRCEHKLTLNLAHDHYRHDHKPLTIDGLKVYPDHQSKTRSLSANLDNNNKPKSLYLAFDYPKDLNESFMIAQDTTVISYSSDNSNFMITLKITPLKEDQPLRYSDFKNRLLKRFSDKDNMLYGQYEILREVKSTQDAIELSRQNPNHSVFTAPIDPNDHYMELTLRAFLKKNSDGLLPDMQNYFYERSIVSNNYIATLSCELFGRQIQSSIVKQQFEALSPLCEHILQSYQYHFQ